MLNFAIDEVSIKLLRTRPSLLELVPLIYGLFMTLLNSARIVANLYQSFAFKFEVLTLLFLAKSVKKEGVKGENGDRSSAPVREFTYGRIKLTDWTKIRVYINSWKCCRKRTNEGEDQTKEGRASPEAD